MTTALQQPAMPAEACDSQLPSASGDGCMHLFDPRDKNRQKLKKWRAKDPEAKRAKQRAYYQANKARLAAKLKAWRKANPEKLRNQWYRKYKKNMATNPELYRQRSRLRYYENREQILARLREQRRALRAQDPDAIRARDRHNRYKQIGNIRDRERQKIADLDDSYIRRILNNATGIAGKQWPQELVACYAAKLKLKRLLWQNQKTSTNSANNS